MRFTSAWPTPAACSAARRVRKSGLLIGRVSKLELVDEGVLLTLRIDKDVQLARSETCLLRNSLFGDAELAFVPREGPPFRSP